MTLLMMGKTTTRLPESLSYGHTPLINHSSKKLKTNKEKWTEDLAWSISKMGQDIDPCNVVLNGSQYVHGKCNLSSFDFLICLLFESF